MKKLNEIDYSILQQCMHCGMCLPTCPTYVETKEERNSPRGRISLMRAIADGELEVSKAFGEEMYYCLGCLACTSACPAGVNYAELFEVARSEVEEKGVLASPKRDGIRWFALRLIFTRPCTLRFVGRLLWLWQSTGLQRFSRWAGLVKLLPKNLRRLEPQTPVIKEKFSHQLIAPVEKPSAQAVTTRRRVAVLTGCVQDLIFADINRATVDVLLANGCEVHTPPVQPCCGSLHAHNGDTETARLLARRKLDLFDPSEFDAIISNAGGCGSHLRHYDHLLEDDPIYSVRALEWAHKLKDISEFLVQIDFRRPTVVSSGGAPMSVTYHESCHLCHGQKVSKQPCEVLKSVPGVELRECAEATWCCGSAGIYNITQPDTAGWLQQRKLGHIRATGAKVIATANPGCHLQIANGLGADGESFEVVHPVVLLARAYRAEVIHMAM
jgi:glycolate oxidase iron-sulfur subunit